MAISFLLQRGRARRTRRGARVDLTLLALAFFSLLCLPAPLLFAQYLGFLDPIEGRSAFEGTLGWPGLSLLAGPLVAYLVALLKLSDLQSGLALEAECADWR